LPEYILNKILDTNAALTTKEGISMMIKNNAEAINSLGNKIIEKVKKELMSVKMEAEIIHSTKLEVKAVIKPKVKAKIKKYNKNC